MNGTRARPTRASDSRNARALIWREEWVRQGKSFWSELARDRSGKLDAYVETKEQYLGLIEDPLKPELSPGGLVQSARLKQTLLDPQVCSRVSRRRGWHDSVLSSRAVARAPG